MLGLSTSTMNIANYEETEITIQEMSQKGKR